MEKKVKKPRPFGSKISRNKDLDFALLDKDSWTLFALRQVVSLVIEELEILHERVDTLSAEVDGEFERVYGSME